MTDQTAMNIACSWSGGKDSCYALMQAVSKGAVPNVIVNMMNENGRVSRSHGLPFSLLQQQATAMQLPIIATPSSWANYEENFIATLNRVKSEYAVEAIVFGDIDLQAHRDWEEMVCKKCGIKPLLPIWQRSRKELLIEMLETGIKAMIVSCNEIMGKSFLGKMLDNELIPALEAKGVDVCGENGEFHTIVLDCPIFNQPVILPPYSSSSHEGYHFLTWDS